MVEHPNFAASSPASTGENVDVHCKLPHGLILRLFEFRDVDQHQAGGGVYTTRIAHPLPEQITLNGWAHKKEDPAPCLIVGGFAVTPGIPKEFMDEWLKQNAEHSVVKAGLIFTSKRGDLGQAKEMAAVKCGLEPLDQDRPTASVKKFDGKPEAA